jgi:hypothetical protein
MTVLGGLRAGVVGTGFVKGWMDTFRELYRAEYGAVAAGGPPPDPDYPAFADGHRANVPGDAIAMSNAERASALVPTTEVTG